MVRFHHAPPNCRGLHERLKCASWKDDGRETGTRVRIPYPLPYKNSLKFDYTGEHELGTKSTNYRKCQEDTESNSLVRFQQRVSIWKIKYTGCATVSKTD